MGGPGGRQGGRAGWGSGVGIAGLAGGGDRWLRRCGDQWFLRHEDGGFAGLGWCAHSAVRPICTFSRIPAVGDEDGERVVGGDQIAHDRGVVDSHEPDVQTRLVLLGDARLVQPDDALVGLAGAQRDDARRVLLADRDLAAREQRHAPPRGHLVPVDGGGARHEAALVALAEERRDRLGWARNSLVLRRMARRFVEVVGGGRPCVGADALAVVDAVQEPELAVVDQLPLLAFADLLDGQAELLLGLVHRVVVEIGDPGVDAQHRLGERQFVLARGEFVVDVAAGEGGLPVVSRLHGDVGLALAVHGLALPLRVRVQVRREGGCALHDLLQGVPGQHEQDAGRLGPHRGEPERVGPADGLVAHLVASVTTPMTSSSPNLPVA
ncbi:hypothetical protein SMD44_08708 [Streptomyces alboflavus]|uniref:Uncharacterized protein n=1 Tax=Streptomyces alboflavus TaxID=67267 RepID=A0A1Z1WRX9_9ACTN|nr:hypothetical protein SMD44_08708 [Streptomyces alboflavus]